MKETSKDMLLMLNADELAHYRSLQQSYANIIERMDGKYEAAKNMPSSPNDPFNDDELELDNVGRGIEKYELMMKIRLSETQASNMSRKINASS